jgi:hypothetical protein
MQSNGSFTKRKKKPTIHFKEQILNILATVECEALL